MVIGTASDYLAGHAADTVIGSSVTIGHQASLHGTTVGDRALIGMNATLLEGSKARGSGGRHGSGSGGVGAGWAVPGGAAPVCAWRVCQDPLWAGMGRLEAASAANIWQDMGDWQFLLWGWRAC